MSGATPGGLGRALAEALSRGGFAGQPGRVFLRVRLVAVCLVLVGLFGLLAHRAFVLQVRERDRLLALAEDQYLAGIDLPARRGRILDRNGAELAASALVDSVSANPRQIAAQGAVEKIARALGRALSLDPRELEKRLHARRFATWIKRRVSPEEARAVRDLALPGVFLQREPRRYYPSRLGGPLLGWAGVDGKGLEGIELSHDGDLRGAPQRVSGLRDALGRELWVEGGVPPSAGEGHDVVTTIDKSIQHWLESALERGVEKSHAKAGVAVALDPRSGEVLGMAAVPTLNPNDPQGAAGSGARNRAVTDPFEPGSTMKTFSIASAIEAEAVALDDTWFCENGRFTIGKATIHDAEPNGTLTTVEVLAKSSNIGTAKIARKSGKERVFDMLHRFGFGQATGVDLPGERGGLLRSPSRWGEIELATISFGQGVTATPLQLASAYAAIANGGTWWKPHVTRAVLDEHGRPLREVRPEGHRIVDESLARTMRGMLHAVTQKGGTAEKLALPGYPAGGKTGTAQKVDPQTRRYSTEKWASSFVGFAPLDDPRLVVFVMVDEPSGSHFGSAVAGPIWREVMSDALPYLNVAPTAEPSAEKPESGAVNGRSAARPRAAASAGTGEGAAVPAGTATGAGFVDADGDDVEAGAGGVPDFRGLSVGEALDLARRSGLALEVVGSGIAESQEPVSGEPAGDRCTVRFSPPGAARRVGASPSGDPREARRR